MTGRFDLDTIRITGLKGHGYHGVLPAERRDGQEFIVDIELGTDTRRAAASDDLNDTVDYGAVARGVYDIIVGPPFSLVEALAARIAQECLSFEPVRSAKVTVHKPHAPVDLPFTDISVSVTRG